MIRSGRLLRRALDALTRGGAAELADAVRRRTRGARLARLAPDEQYRRWLRRHAPPAGGGDASFRVLLFGDAGDEARAATEASLRTAGARCSLEPVPAGGPLPDAGDADFVTAVAAGDVLETGALAALAVAVWEAGGRAIAYADEDRHGPGGGRSRPFLKPAWSPLLSLTLPGLYPGSPAAIPAALWNEIRGASRDSEAPWVGAVLRAADRAERIAHVPRPLLTRRVRGGDRDPLLGPPAARASCAARALERRGGTVALEPGARPETLRPVGTGPIPRVSVLLLTRDLPEHLLPLGRSLEALLARLPLEWIVVDHLTRDPDALAYLTHLADRGSARILRDEGAFEYARLVNRAAREATGDLLLLLNNDVEPLTDDWVERLARAATLPGVDAAGALLLYPDGTVQHGGIDVGCGTGTDHFGRGDGPDADPPWPPVDVAREVSAVTGACLMVRRAAFESVGGLDERAFAVSYNDVDLCLRLAARGGRTVLEPGARLVHHETRTRSPRLDAAEVRAFRGRWADILRDDPHAAPARFRLTASPHLDLWRTVPPHARVTDTRERDERSRADRPPDRG